MAAAESVKRNVVPRLAAAARTVARAPSRKRRLVSFSPRMAGAVVFGRAVVAGVGPDPRCAGVTAPGTTTLDGADAALAPTRIFAVAVNV